VTAQTTFVAYVPLEQSLLVDELELELLVLLELLELLELVELLEELELLDTLELLEELELVEELELLDEPPPPHPTSVRKADIKMAARVLRIGTPQIE
jgi:hypothetical protein